MREKFTSASNGGVGVSIGAGIAGFKLMMEPESESESAFGGLGGVSGCSVNDSNIGLGANVGSGEFGRLGTNTGFGGFCGFGANIKFGEFGGFGGFNGFNGFSANIGFG